MKIKQISGEVNSLNYLCLKIVTIMIALFLIGVGNIYSKPDESQQQPLVVTCIVTDNTGEPMTGVSVVVTGTGVGTVTDINGRCQITAPADGTLTISYLGFKQAVIPVSNRTSIDVTMEEDTKMIDEVVVVGYGTQRKATLTGAVASIKGEVLVTVKNENVQNMLTGKLPGVRVWQRSAEPGAFDTRFDIRGFGTPLVVIDGIVRTMDELKRLSGNDIDDISVLKDGSAAIYGVRAANGVLLVTTKKGSASKKANISYSGSYSLQFPSGLPDVVDIYEWMTIQNWGRQNVRNGIITPAYVEADWNDYRSGAKKSYDWNDYVLNSSTPETEHNLSISGGNDRTQYYFSTSYLYQNSFFKGNDRNYNRWNVVSNLSTKLSDNLTFETKIDAIVDEQNQPRESAVWTIRDYWRMNPRVGPYADDAETMLNQAVTETENPVSMIYSDFIGFQQRQRKYMNGSASLSLELLKGLTLKGMVGYNYNYENYREYWKKCLQYTYNEANETYAQGVASRYGIDRFRHEQYIRTQLNSQFILNYKEKFDNHDVGATVVWESTWRNGDNLYAQRDLIFPRGTLAAGGSAGQEGSMSTGSGNYYNRNSNGLAGRFSYGYADRYLFDFLFRYDGSSNFAPGYQWGFFPGALLAWRIAEEDFIKQSSLSFIEQLKLRASYSITGNDESGQYQFMPGYNYPVGNDSRNFSSGYVFNGSWVGSVANRGIPNPYITWYKAKTTNIGLDFEAWNGLFGFTVEYFNRDMDGRLGRRTGGIPTVVGADLPEENLNGERQFGMEIELTHNKRIGDFSYKSSLWGSITRQQRLHWDERTFNSSRDRWLNGQDHRYQGIYRTDWEYTGQFQNWDQIWNNSYFIGPDKLPGSYMYKDWNGDGEMTGYDNHPIRFDQTPWVNYALNFQATYKQLDLTLLFQGSALASLQVGEQARGESTTLRMMLDRWHPVNNTDDPYDPTTQWVKSYYAFNPRDQDSSTFNTYDGSYLRLKNIELGYTIPKFKGMNLRVFVGGYNVFTITEVKYFDPEHPGGGESWGFMYPLNKTLTFGLTLKF